MPHANFITTRGEHPRFFYNLDATVGPRGANRRLDVLFVQYALRTSFAGGLCSERPSPGGTIELTGVLDSATAMGILHYQTITNWYVKDGNFDPVPPNLPLYARYALYRLNTHLECMLGDDYFDAETWGPELPAELVAALRWNRSVHGGESGWCGRRDSNPYGVTPSGF